MDEDISIPPFINAMKLLDLKDREKVITEFEDELIDQERVTSMPVKKGGMVLLHHRTIHGALDNNSDRIRWSFDLRYNVIGSATGRDVFPGFVARSAAEPESELIDADKWADNRTQSPTPESPWT